MASNFFSNAIRSIRKAFSSPREDDNTLYIGASSLNASDRDRFTYDRSETLELALKAWRENPLARRIVALTSQYVVGGGISISCQHPVLNKFLQDFWHHPLNNIPIKTYEWCDELTRSGNLFLLLTTDQAGMSYIRAIPAANIERIEHAPHDIEQPTLYYLKPSAQNLNPQPIPAFNYNSPLPLGEGRGEGILHYAINKPVGAQWGESDLAPLLKWLSRYANWLEDRARLNRYRTAFLYVVKGRYASEADRIRRQQFLNTNPPSPGSILVADESENWEIISPKLEAHEAAEDGLSLKKIICAGAGIPLHFLAEPESSTRTTAEAAGGPTFRHFEQRQNFFVWLLTDLCKAAISRRRAYDKRIPARPEFSITASDISSRDNVALGLAATHINSIAKDAYERQLISPAEYLRLIYKFSGETVDIQSILQDAAASSPPIILPSNPSPLPSERGLGVRALDPQTGDLKESIANP
ncbi:MAG: hypothetical protein HPY45_14800 [Anaerolineae bacterium]|nr:hypothetical protein [Anaerolineae bacterium]